ncbi:hypothetical protein EH223_15295 [candidate division KSB1 bacterium]|nr:MAG: hypothetical protein EH223_15295 [candidate division KSB1 bacterium]
MILRFIKALKQRHFMSPLAAGILAALAFFFVDCTGRQNRFQPLYYFPLNVGNTWVYNGEIHKMQISDITKNEGDRLITFSFYDTLNVLLWQEKAGLLKDQIYVQSFEPMTSLLPSVSFDPPRPFAPFSRKLGNKLNFPCIETCMSDSTHSTTTVEAEYVIETVEDVRVPAGKFLDCIKMKINIIYPRTAEKPFFIGEQYWWYAPLVGPIKYDLPSARGELVEMNIIRTRQVELLE